MAALAVTVSIGTRPALYASAALLFVFNVRLRHSLYLIEVTVADQVRC